MGFTLATGLLASGSMGAELECIDRLACCAALLFRRIAGSLSSSYSTSAAFSSCQHKVPGSPCLLMPMLLFSACPRLSQAPSPSVGA